MSLLLPALALAMPQPDTQKLSGRILNVDAGARTATMDLTALQVTPGMLVQVLRRQQGRWQEVATGHITSVTPGSSHLAVDRLEPGQDPPGAGDIVLVHLDRLYSAEPSAPALDQPAEIMEESAPGRGIQAEPLVPAGHRSARGAPEPPEPTDGTSPLLELAVGPVGGFVATLKRPPAQAPEAEEGMWGPGGGGGLLISLRAWRYLLLEVGGSYELLTLSKTTTIPVMYQGEAGYVTTRYQPNILMTQIRLPIRIGASLPVGDARLSVQIGPEVAIGLGTATSLTITTPGRTLEGEAARDLERQQTALKKQYGGRSVTQVLLNLALGVDFPAGPLLIPLRLGAAYNPSESSEFVNYWTPGAGGTQRGEHTLDLRLWIGLQYQLELL